MSQHPFAALITLVTFDKDMRQVNQEIKDIEKETEVLSGEVRKLSKQLEQDKQKLVELRKDVDTAELEMKALDAQEAGKRTKLDNALDNKEFQSLRAELERVQRAQVEQEQKVVVAWNRLEAEQKNYVEKIELHSAKIEDIKQNIEKKNQVIVSKKEFILSQQIHREERAKSVPEEWLEKYESMQSHVADPVVEVVSDSCSACGSMLTISDLQKINRGALLQCKYCYRLLYSPKIISNIA